MMKSAVSVAELVKGSITVTVSRRMGRTKKSSLQSPKEAAPAQAVGGPTKSKQTRKTKAPVQIATQTMARGKDQKRDKTVEMDAVCRSSAEEVTAVKRSLRQKRKLMESQTADDQSTTDTSKKKKRLLVSQKSSMGNSIHSSHSKTSGTSKRSIKQDAPSANKQPHSGASAASKVEGSNKANRRSSNARKKSRKDLSKGTDISLCSAAENGATVQKESAVDADSTGHAGPGSGKLVGSHCSIAGWYMHHDSNNNNGRDWVKIQMCVSDAVQSKITHYIHS